MGVADFGRRLVRYVRYVRAMPGRVAQLPDLGAGLDQLRADLAGQNAASRAELERLHAGLAGQNAASRAELERLHAGLAGQNAASRDGLERLQTELTELREEIAEQSKAAYVGIEQLRAELAEQRKAARAGLKDSRAELAKHAAATANSIVGEIAAQIGFTFYDFDQRLSELISALKATDVQFSETNNLVDHVNASFESRLRMMDTQLAETKNLITHINTSTETRFNALDTQLAETKNLTTHINTSTETRFNVLDTQLAEANNLLAHINASTESKFNVPDAQLSAAKNLVTHLATSTESRFNVLGTQLSETKSLVTHINTSVHTRLNALESELISGLYDQLRELAATHFEVRGRAASNRAQWTVHSAERYEQAKPASFRSYLAKAKQDFPVVYPLWLERLDATLEAFRKTKIGNAAHVGDPDSRVFRTFIEMYAAGRALDVGCGVFGRPYYLTDYPSKLISGLEPLPMIEPADFELVRGVGECLPWPNESFSTVISATSLDHCLSLKRSLDEIVRVLRPGGRFLLWIDSVPGAPAYEPDKPGFKPADQFHLFHFDTSWFEPMLEQSFTPITQTQLRHCAFSRVMYCLVKK